MYSTCLFCHSALGQNEVVEHFPVGRRLAFDAARGRLWVVCRKCERWNLTPVEERWEAIDECERLFRNTRLRASTEHIGLARLREGLELVRIGVPQRPEMAAWRYGDQFGRRRNRRLAIVAGSAIVAGGVLAIGPLFGTFALLSPMLNLGSTMGNLYFSRRVMARITLPGHDSPVILRTEHLRGTVFTSKGTNWELSVAYHLPKTPRDPRTLKRKNIGEAVLVGEDAIRVAGQLLPAINAGGASKKTVTRAVDLLERTPETAKLFAQAAAAPLGNWRPKRGLSVLPPEMRLALEMAVHEESERRALEGELSLLENAWKDAEETASIADTLLVPPEVSDQVAGLRNGLTRPPEA